MDSINDIIRIIQKNYTTAFVGALIAIFLAGVALARHKFISVLLIISSVTVLYLSTHKGKVGKFNIKDIKKKVKTKVIETLDC